MFEDNVRPLGIRRSFGPKLIAPDPAAELRELLIGNARHTRDLRELPAFPDLVAAAIALASGTRRKVILPLSDAPAEFAFVRSGDRVLIDCYGTESAPEVFLRERAITLDELLAACVDAGRRLAANLSDPTNAAAMLQLSQRAADTTPCADPQPQPRPLSCSGGSLQSPGNKVPLAFGFSAEIVPSPDQNVESHAFADVHALLFPGTLWAFAGDKRVGVFEGSIMLAAQRMVAAVRALCEAWQAERNVHVRLRSGAFWVAVRRERNGAVSLTLSGGRGDALTWPALDVAGAALPILRLASDLIRKLIAADRRQSHNLRVTALRSEVRALRRMIRARDRRESFENSDPERLRLSTPDTQDSPTSVQPNLAAHAAGLRYVERWSAAIDGLDASSVYLCGEQLVIATQKLTLSLARASGEVQWSQPSSGAVTMLAGRTLLRLLPDGMLELHELADGSVRASTQTAARGGAGGPWLFAGGGSLPPMVILTEARQHLVAVDLRTGQPRWRFRAHGPGNLQLARSGRVLCVTSGDGTVDALDIASGEVVWRFGDDVRFSLKPTVSRDIVVAVAGEPRGGVGSAYGIELYTGRVIWQRELPAAPSCDPIDAGALVVLPYGRSQKARLLALHARSGEVCWDQADPGLDNGGQALALDSTLVVNTPAGRVLALELTTGVARWTRSLANPLTDDVPRQLEPVLRQGALFVPSAQVHMLRPQDGSSLTQIGCDLVPDCLRVDERGSFYVAEESGHVCAYAAGPQLALVR
jgi:outer membrane protein assembly factor BamB